MVHVETAFADGGVIGRNPSPVGGTWAWLHVSVVGGITEQSGVVTPADINLPAVTNNLTELLACILALEALPDGWDGTLYSDSHVTRCRLVNQNPGFAGIPQAFQDRVWAARQRLGNFKMVLLDGHPTKAQLLAGFGKRGNPCSRHNVRADFLCGERAKEFLSSKNKEAP